MNPRAVPTRSGSVVKLICAVLLCAVPLSAQDIRVYDGTPFTNVHGDFDTTMEIAGGVVFSEPLRPDLPLQDMTSQVLSYSFFDGLQTLTESNSFMMRFHVATDGACRMSRWEIAFWQLNLFLINGIDLSANQSSVLNDGFVDAPCADDGQPCTLVFVTEARHYGIGENTSPEPWSEPEECITDLFADDFESGDLGNWSQVSP